MRTIKSLNDSLSGMRNDYAKEPHTVTEARNIRKYIGALKQEKRLVRRNSSGSRRGSR